jgi:hypothetical protein
MKLRSEVVFFIAIPRKDKACRLKEASFDNMGVKQGKK